MTSLQGVNLDAESIQAGAPFLENIGVVYSAYNSLMRNAIELGIILVLLFLVVNGAIWLGAHYLINPLSGNWKDKSKLLAKQWLKYVASAVVILIPFFIAAYFINGIYPLFPAFFTQLFPFRDQFAAVEYLFFY